MGSSAEPKTAPQGHIPPIQLNTPSIPPVNESSRSDGLCKCSSVSMGGSGALAEEEFANGPGMTGLRQESWEVR